MTAVFDEKGNRDNSFILKVQKLPFTSKNDASELGGGEEVFCYKFCLAIIIVR